MKVVWDALEPEAWAAALPPEAAALQQSWRYGAALAALGRRVRRGEIRCGGARFGLVQVVERRLAGLRLAYLPRGPVWIGDPPPETRRAALRLVGRALPGRGPRLLLAAPELAEPALLPLMSPQWLAEIALGPDRAAMRRRMHGKWRNRLVRAEQADLRLSCTAPSDGDLARLAAREAAQGRARGYRPLPATFLQAWAAAGRGGAWLYAARRRGETLAEMLFLDHAPGASYQIGWSGPAGRAASAHHLILWRAICDFADQGRSRLDLGTLDTVTAPGLARFKLGAGAAPRPLGPAGMLRPGLPGARQAAFVQGAIRGHAQDA